MKVTFDVMSPCSYQPSPTVTGPEPHLCLPKSLPVPALFSLPIHSPCPSVPTLQHPADCSMASAVGRLLGEVSQATPSQWDAAVPYLVQLLTLSLVCVHTQPVRSICSGCYVLECEWLVISVFSLVPQLGSSIW